MDHAFRRLACHLPWMCRLWGSGGMPSSHTAFVIALTTAVWIRDGGGSSTFAICVVIASVTAYDAAGVRWHSGRTASLLNALVGELPPEHPIQEHESAGRLRDQLGHTPEEVAGGALVGILIGIFVEGLIFKVILKQGI
eukprot:366390-Chlamydomonas_euryale.AAC.33